MIAVCIFPAGMSRHVVCLAAGDVPMLEQVAGLNECLALVRFFAGHVVEVAHRQGEGEWLKAARSG